MKDLKIFYIVGCLALLIAIFVFLPMFFTYLSSGDPRAPSEIHPSDPVGPKITKDHGAKSWGKSKDINKGYKSEDVNKGYKTEP